MTNRTAFAGCIAALCLGGAALPAAAQTSTQSFTVSANVQATCVISASNLDFGPYVPTQTNDASTSVAVTCTSGTPYNIKLSGGTGGTVADRQMTGASSSDKLRYNLYSDSSRSAVWGETIDTDTVSRTGSGAAQTIPVYGRSPAGQFVPPQGYSDTIIATVAF